MTHPPVDPTPARSRVWHLVFWPTLITTAACAMWGLHVLSRTLDDGPLYWLGERLDVLRKPLHRIAYAREIDLGPRVLYLGDSTVSEYERGKGLTNLTRLELRRTHGHDEIQLASLAGPGSGVDQYALLADRIADSRPDLVIWQISYFQFTDRWTSMNGAPELVGYVDPERLSEILDLPYERLGMSLSDIILHQGIVRLGLHRVHRRLRKSQMRFARLRPQLEEALNPNKGRSPEARAKTLRARKYLLRHIDQTLRNRYTELGERMHFESSLSGLEPDEVRLQLLRSGISALRREGIEVLVYMNPTNFDHLRNLGIYDERGIAQTLEEIRRVTDETGAHFIDLSELLRDEDFVDAPGHFLVDDENTVPRKVAREVAAAANRILRGEAAQPPTSAAASDGRPSNHDAGEPGAGL